VKDKYGLTWQLILTNPEGEERPVIIPSLLYVGDVAGKAREAIDLYTSVFKDSKKGTMIPYGSEQTPEKEGTLMFAEFALFGQWFTAMDSAQNHKFNFNEAVSLLVECEDQAEIDYYWEKLSANSDAEQCGWLKDKFGVSWQIAPSGIEEMLLDPDRKKVDRMLSALQEMKKLDIAELRRAFEG
jgi:predicted 3-demethylubiquinone-9 3-methyltransferase (glyoxalase superfamily)